MGLVDEYSRQYRWRNWQAIHDRLPLRPGHLVVDLGCAIGDQAADLASRGANVLGIDGNDELLAAASARGIPRAVFRHGDLRTWSEPDLQADGLWSSFSAAYFPDFAPVLRCWLRALRPGGFVVLVEIDDLFGHRPLCQATAAGLAGYCDDAARSGRYDFHMGSRLRAHAVAAGLEPVAEIPLPDRELAFDGPADPAVVDAWRLRLDRMTLLQKWFGPDWQAARTEFLAALVHPDHRATARVVLLLARKPLP